ncbi:chromatin binding protein [Cryptotrichosporon argae]
MQQLLNPFAQKYPERTDACLASQAACAAFNPAGPYAGHYLAAGGGDGAVEVWDTATRRVVRVFEAHVRAVSSVSWSRNNRYLISASLDSTAVIHDLAPLSHPLLAPVLPSADARAAASTSTSTSARAAGRVGSVGAGASMGPAARVIRFDAPLAAAELHPRNAKLVLATLTVGEVVLVDIRRGGGRWVLADTMDGEDGQGQGKAAALACARFSRDGTRIYAGTTHGVLLIFDPVRRAVAHRIRLGSSAIKQLAFDAPGRNLVVSSSDRALRVCDVDPRTGLLTPAHRFQDMVNRTPWHAVGFSGDGEYVMGGAGHKVAHNVFVWDRESGVLVKVLEGPKENLVDCDWHPTRPVIASVTASGDIYLWQTTSPDNWAAFAPGFEELEENIEYDEREDEFDIEDETDLARRKDAEEDMDVDVLTPQDDAYPRRPVALPPLPPVPAREPASTSHSNSNSSGNGSGDSNGNGDLETAGERAGEPEPGARHTEPADDPDEPDDVRAARAMRAAVAWAEAEPDDDTWDAFYPSVDLTEVARDEDE